MRRHDVNLTSLVLKCFLIAQISPIVLSCIYLLNGWTPMSVYNRTSRADIVLSAHVIRTYKEAEYRTPAMTYTATVKLLDVYKGQKLLRNIPVDDSTPYVYNVSNFGDRKMCYADVSDGKNYILFLTTYKQRLSAKYDDIFGAATRYTEYNVKDIKSQVGTDLSDWTVWSSCSRTCDGGYQVRRRSCKSTSGDCDQGAMDKRACNVFSCTESRDLLGQLSVYDLPLGVYHSADRPGAFSVTTIAKVFSLFSNVYPEHMPQNFSLLMSLKLSSNFSGYVFTLSDLIGNQKLAVKFTMKDTKSAMVFEYSDDSSKASSTSTSFEFEITTHDWHQFGISVTVDVIELYIDCETVIKESQERPLRSPISSNLMMSIGPYFARFGSPFQGEIEQLIMTEDPTAAARHCVISVEETDIAVKDEGDNNNNIADISTDRDDSTAKGNDRKELSGFIDDSTQYEWTEWSPCSRTCGRGVQKRNLYCGNGLISTCSPDGVDDLQVRWCYRGSCSVKCRPKCKNGGTCHVNGTCLCSEGYTGTACETPDCSPPCSNGGRCVKPGQCACPVGYTGQLCETAICNPPCANGGQCIQPGYCTCPYGYMPPACEPICLLPCRNGGRCKRFDKCSCRRGYTGRDCSIPVCRRGCFNGGRCVAPNKCSCPHGFLGSRCHKPVCNPVCRNGGRCLYPGICKCRHGYGGPLCENFVCKRPCENGGTCSENNTCACPDGYRGRWCNKKNKPKSKCLTTCLNGGKCRKKRCRCAPGFTGRKCEKRQCKYETYLKPYIITFRNLERQEIETKCGKWHWRTCLETRSRYTMSTKTVYRPAYRCV